MTKYVSIIGNAFGGGWYRVDLISKCRSFESQQEKGNNWNKMVSETHGQVLMKVKMSNTAEPYGQFPVSSNQDW